MKAWRDHLASHEDDETACGQAEWGQAGPNRMPDLCNFHLCCFSWMQTASECVEEHLWPTPDELRVQHFDQEHKSDQIWP